jgi:aspartyl/asparaginyl beta-hydroxylase (cupin superfamily)
VIIKNHEVIKAELLEYLKDHTLESYFNASMVEKKDTWKTAAIKWWGINLFQNQKIFPQTSKIINSFPNIVSASFNLLEANAKIKPHHGDTNAIFRCHLALIIPKENTQCGFTVKGDTKHWEEGKMLIFIDALYHEAYNNSEEDRYIFLFDVLRDEFLEKEKYVCSTVITSLFLQKFAERLKFLYKSPNWIIRTVGFILYPFSRISLYLVNKYKLY